MPNIENGDLRNVQTSGKIMHGQTLEIVCDKNFEMPEPEYPRCFNGTWSYVPKCLPSNET